MNKSECLSFYLYPTKIAHVSEDLFSVSNSYTNLIISKSIFLSRKLQYILVYIISKGNKAIYWKYRVSSQIKDNLYK